MKSYKLYMINLNHIALNEVLHITSNYRLQSIFIVEQNTMRGPYEDSRFGFFEI